MLWRLFLKLHVMNNNPFSIFLWRRPLLILILLPLSIFCSQAQNSRYTFISQDIANAQYVKYLGPDRSILPQINLVNVFPNPALIEGTLVFNSSEDNVVYELRIVNNAGIGMNIINGTTLKGQNTISFPVGDYAPGIYYAQFVTSGNTESLRFIK